MFGGGDSPDEERLECMVKLYTTCGKKLDQSGSPDAQKASASVSWCAFDILRFFNIVPSMGNANRAFLVYSARDSSHGAVDW